MSVTAKVVAFGLKDLVRSKWSLFYTAFFLITTEGLLRMVAEPSKVMLSLMNVTLYLVPLVSVIFGTMYHYNSRDFFKLILAQPIKRSTVYIASFFGLSLSLTSGFIIGVSVPFAIHGYFNADLTPSIVTLLVVGLCLTWSFVGVAFLIAVSVIDRGKGIGLAIFAWILLAILYDGAVLFAAHLLSEYPLEKPMLGIALLNPIDLGRILLLLEMDTSALMGYTGAVFQRFFGTSTGLIIAGLSLIVWSMLPGALGMSRFLRRDL